MDLVSLSGSLATIVCLMADFAAERRSQEAATFQDFTEWLLRHHHERTLELLEQNARTAAGIKALLNHNQQRLIELLSAIDDGVARIASGYPELRPIVESMKPRAMISDQALSILEQFSTSGASEILEERQRGGVLLHCIGRVRTQLAYSEPRYLDDDLATLLDLGFLRLKHDGEKARIFIYTREAERFVASARGVTSSQSATDSPPV